MSTYYYAPSTQGFYLDGLNQHIPSDAILITEQQWQALVNGKAEGKLINVVNNVPTLVDPPAPTPSQIVKAQENVVRAYLNAGAAQRHYDSITTVCSYSTSANVQFKSEADTCIPWRDACWENYLSYVQSVESGATPWTDAELTNHLPKLVWPTIPTNPANV
jgi:hypothetical protein